MTCFDEEPEHQPTKEEYDAAMQQRVDEKLYARILQINPAILTWQLTKEIVNADVLVIAKAAIAASRYENDEILSPDILEHVAKALWNWEHENRENKILDIEWSLLRSDYLCRAQVMIAAYQDCIKGSIVMNNKAWDKQKAILDGWSPEEVEILYADYQKYLEQHQRWHWKDGLVMDFDDWWRAMADNVKDNREGK